MIYLLLARDNHADTEETDIDTEPMTISVKCSSCGKVKEHKIIGEELGNYTLDEKTGTYTSQYGECSECLTGEKE